MHLGPHLRLRIMPPAWTEGAKSGLNSQRKASAQRRSAGGPASTGCPQIAKGPPPQVPPPVEPLRQLPQLQRPGRLRQLEPLRQLPRLQQLGRLRQLEPLRQLPRLQQLGRLRQRGRLQQCGRLRQHGRLRQLRQLQLLLPGKGTVAWSFTEDSDSLRGLLTRAAPGETLLLLHFTWLVSGLSNLFP